MLRISTKIKFGYLFAKIKGDLDMHTVPDFKEKIIAELNTESQNIKKPKEK